MVGKEEHSYTKGLPGGGGGSGGGGGARARVCVCCVCVCVCVCRVGAANGIRKATVAAIHILVMGPELRRLPVVGVVCAQVVGVAHQILNRLGEFRLADRGPARNARVRGGGPSGGQPNRSRQ